MRYLKFAGILLIFIFLVSCQMNTKPFESISSESLTIQQVGDIYNVHWTLTSVTTDTGDVSLSDYLPFLLILSTNDSMFGTNGCNLFKGNYQHTATEISFGSIYQTKFPCRRKTLYTPDILSGTWVVTFTDTSITLSRGNESRTFVSHYATPLTNFPAVGFTWKLQDSNHPRFGELTDVTPFQLTITENREARIQWQSLKDTSVTNTVQGYFNLGQQNGAFIRWWKWNYQGFQNPANPPADLALVTDLEEVRYVEFSNSNTVMELRTGDGVYFRFQKQ